MSTNFIPAAADNAVEENRLPVFYELARSLETLELLTCENKFYFVSKDEAIKIWVLKALNRQTSRYTHRAYSKDYGNEINQLFGRQLSESLLKSELKRYIEEALLVNPYITKISNLFFEKFGSKVNATFTVTTVYGEFEQEYNYENED